MDRVDYLLVMSNLPDWSVTDLFREQLERANDEEAWALIEDRRVAVEAGHPGATHHVVFSGTKGCTDEEAALILADCVDRLGRERRLVALGSVELHDPDTGERIGWQILTGPRQVPASE